MMLDGDLLQDQTGPSLALLCPVMLDLEVEYWYPPCFDHRSSPKYCGESESGP